MKTVTGNEHGTGWMESVEKNDWNTVLQEGMMHETGDDVLNTAAIANKHYRGDRGNCNIFEINAHYVDHVIY